MILALDLATVVGWSAGVPGGAPMFGHHRFAPAGAGAGVVAAAAIDWMTEKFETIKPTFVFAEDQYIGKKINPDTIRRLYGLRFVCEAMCERHGARLQWVPVSTLSAFFTGFAKWPRGEKKGATIRVAHLYGFRVTDDNEADAVALFLWGEHQISPHLAGQRSMGTLFTGGQRRADTGRVAGNA